MERLVRLFRHPLLRIWFTGRGGVLWPITVVAGVAGCILAAWHVFKGQDQGQRPAEPRDDSRVGSASGGQAALPEEPISKPQTAITSSCGGIVAGAGLITMCAAGVLLHEATPGQLEDSATLRREAVEPLQKLLQGGGRVVIIAHTESEVGLTAVQAALEDVGLLGTSPSQLPPHRLLSCSTNGGKASMVRQLEPDVHLESDLQAASDVQKFVKRVVVINSGGQSSAREYSLLRVATLADVLK